MSSTTGAAASSAAHTQAAQGRHSAARRPQSEATGPADLFANLLGLLADTRGGLPPDEGATTPASTEDETPLASPSLALAEVTSPAAGLENGQAASGHGGPLGATHERQTAGAGLTLPAEPADGGGRTGAVLAGEPAARDPSGETTPTEGAAVASAADAPGAPARARPAASLPRAADRPMTLMLQKGDSVTWRPGGPTGPATAATAGAPVNAPMTRSTVTLDQRFALGRGADRASPWQTEGGANPGTWPATAVGAGLGSASAGHGGTTNGDGASLSAGSEGGSADTVSDAPEAPFDLDMTGALEDQDLRGWTAAGLRQASLKLDQGSAEAIDIDISLRGQEVSVDFRTDHADARNTLQSQAGQALSDLLQRSGMQLGGLSVGGQAAGDRHAPGEPPANPSARRDEARAGPGETAPAGDALHRSAPGGGKSSLDLFV